MTKTLTFFLTFRILSLKTVTFVSRHNMHMLRAAVKQPYDDVRTCVWSELKAGHCSRPVVFVLFVFFTALNCD